MKPNERDLAASDPANNETLIIHIPHASAFRREAFARRSRIVLPNGEKSLPSKVYLMDTQPLPAIPVSSPVVDSVLRLAPGPEAARYQARGKEMLAETIEEACPVVPKARRGMSGIGVAIALLGMTIVGLGVAIVWLLLSRG